MRPRISKRGSVRPYVRPLEIQQKTPKIAERGWKTLWLYTNLKWTHLLASSISKYICPPGLVRCYYAFLQQVLSVRRSVRLSVRWSVRLSVRWSVRRSVCPFLFLVLFSNDEYGRFWGEKVIKQQRDQWYNEWRWSSRIWCSPAELVFFLFVNIAFKTFADLMVRKLRLLPHSKCWNEAIAVLFYLKLIQFSFIRRQSVFQDLKA